MPENPPQVDFNNPLEKIEQLLTCAICLDRYRHPKLLPCQHTFCMEPCLEGLVDPVKREVKCPECRATHALPYEGVKSYMTNYTLMGFLEIHLQATESNAAELDGYIRRYNMERCKVCDEKSEVDFCPHCEKRICAECKTAHADMLKRDMSRLTSQVKRISGRVQEASESLSRGIDSLQTNCDSTKEEIRDYVSRFVRELKKREETLLDEVDSFYQTETRQMRNCRDNLELEATNVSEATSRVESALKGDAEMSDDDLVKYKQLFLEGLEHLRVFNPDADEFTTKRIRFATGPDPHVLPHAISQFGELQIFAAHLNTKLASGGNFIPKFMNMVMESDNYPTKRKNWAGDNTTDVYPWQRDGLRGSDRSKSSLGPGEISRVSRRSPLSTTETPAVRTYDTSNSPWARVQHLTEPQANNTDSTGNSSSAASENSTESSSNGHPIDPPANQSRLKHLGDTHESETDAKLDQKVDNIRRDYESRHPHDSNPTATEVVVSAKSPAKPYRTRTKTMPEALLREISPLSTGLTKSSSDEGETHAIPVVVYPDPITSRHRQFQEKIIPPLHVSTNYPNSSKSERNSPVPSAALDWKKYLIPNQPSTPTTTNYTSRSTALTDERRSSSRDSDSDLPWNERRLLFKRSKTNPDFLVEQQDNERNQLREKSAINSSSSTVTTEYRKRTGTGGAVDYEDRPRYRRSDSTTDLSAPVESTPTVRESDDRRNRYRRKAERSHSAYNYGGADDSEDNSNTPTKTKTDPAEPQRLELSLGGTFRVFTSPKIDYLEKGRMMVKFGSKGSQQGQFNWPRGVTIVPGAQEIAVCDSSNHRVQIFDKRGSFIRAFGSYGSAKGEFDCLAGICVNKYRQFVITDRYNHRVQIFDSTGRFLRDFGSHGQSNGRFNSPWGIVVDSQGFIYVCDKDNHRIQIFQADGNYVGKFGSIGNRDGQFQNPHFLATNRSNQILVTDSSNHRVQVFDHNGHFLFSFGREGFHDGEFKYPRGIAVDEQGFIVVADSGNNRLQVFYPDGRFYAQFCTWGTADGQLKGVEGVALMDDGRIVATDRENHRVQIF